jgi:hypothetical protein
MTLLSGLIALADNLTQNFGLQADVVYHRYVSSNGAGKRSYEAPVTRKAIYTRTVKQVRTFSGEMAVSNAQIVFLDATVINEFDMIVLPDGTTQPIIGTDAFVDSTKRTGVDANLSWIWPAFLAVRTRRFVTSRSYRHLRLTSSHARCIKKRRLN